jgi:CDP-diacylglycerol--glycerol-3-phosphate 3-phosphatidyltransferase
MNLPNQLTVLRIALVPVFVALLLFGHPGWALLCFAVAALTDALDGYIARSRNLITTFGKLMDPLADKILVMAAMLCLVELKLAPSYVVILILAREFLVTSLRLIAVGEGVVIAADIYGKAKTVVQILWILAALAALWLDGPVFLRMTADLLMWLSLLLTLLSGGNYVIKNRKLLLSDL